MFSINLYSKINTNSVEKKEGFDNTFFKSIALYQAVVRNINENDEDIVIFKDKVLEDTIQQSLRKIYNLESDFFESLFMDLEYILRSNNLQVGGAGLLKKDNDNIIFSLTD